MNTYFNRVVTTDYSSILYIHMGRRMGKLAFIFVPGTHLSLVLSTDLQCEPSRILHGCRRCCSRSQGCKNLMYIWRASHSTSHGTWGTNPSLGCQIGVVKCGPCRCSWTGVYRSIVQGCGRPTSQLGSLVVVGRLVTIW